MTRDHGHVIALEHAALTAFDTGRPHQRKVRIPPGPAARDAATRLRDQTGTTPTTGGEVVIDMSRYAAAAETRRTLPADDPEGLTS